MPLLHIEHGITDLDAWLKAFDRHEAARNAAGVKAARVTQPAEDSQRVVIDLEFESTSAAANFHTFLREHVWPSTDASELLTETPRAVILTEVRR
jgi:hypothetical protein